MITFGPNGEVLGAEYIYNDPRFAPYLQNKGAPKAGGGILASVGPSAARYAVQQALASQAAAGVPTVGMPVANQIAWGANQGLSGIMSSGSVPGMASYAAPAAFLAAGAYGAKDLADWQGDTPRGKRTERGVLQGAASGASLGMGVGGPVGAVVGGVIGSVAGLVGSLTGSGKGYDQMQRDALRKELKKRGIVDADYNLKFSDGSTYNIGKDGNTKLQSADGSQRYAFNVDFNDPRAADTVAATDAIASILTGGDKRQKEWFSGYYANAALSEAKDDATVGGRISDLFRQHGLDKELAMKQLTALKDAGHINDQEFGVFASKVQQYAPETTEQKTPQQDKASTLLAEANKTLTSALGYDLAERTRNQQRESQGLIWDVKPPKEKPAEKVAEPAAAPVVEEPKPQPIARPIFNPQAGQSTKAVATDEQIKSMQAGNGLGALNLRLGGPIPVKDPEDKRLGSLPGAFQTLSRR